MIEVTELIEATAKAYKEDMRDHDSRVGLMEWIVTFDNPLLKSWPIDGENTSSLVKCNLCEGTWNNLLASEIYEDDWERDPTFRAWYKKLVHHYRSKHSAEVSMLTLRII